MHELWKPVEGLWGDNSADIGILFMPEPIPFSIYIQPICLWESDEELKISEGISVGWGSSNGKYSPGTIPTMLKLPIRKPDDCNAVQGAFCAGEADGRGTCRGDSGSGFIVFSGDAYYLRGIVSNAVHSLNCEHNKWAVYTDVLKYQSWIEKYCTMEKR